MTMSAKPSSAETRRKLRRVAIAGSPRGQLFHELLRSMPDGVEAVPLVAADGSRLDVSDRDAVLRAVGAADVDGLINAAAWTAVDLAESEPAQAHAVNADGAAWLSEAAREAGAHLVQVSTDFVFGTGSGRPLAVSDATGPVSVYGQSKLEGERRIAETLPSAAIVRTAWVYSAHGSNFVKTMLRLMGEREELGVVADQIGAPTWAAALATALWRADERRASGVMHWTGAGVASWYDFAVAIAEEGRAAGLLTRDVRVRPVGTSDYPTPAARPAYSVLDLTSAREILGLEPAHWRHDLRTMLAQLAVSSASSDGATRPTSLRASA